MSETFELWAHRGRGDLYAVRQTDGCVTGVCGPLPPEIMGIVDLTGCRYQDPAAIEARRHDYLPAEAWALGFENRAVILGALARAARATGSADHGTPGPARAAAAITPGAPARGAGCEALVRT